MMGWKRRFRSRRNKSALYTLAWYSGASMSLPVTKFSVRMYGSEKAVEEEQQRHENAGFSVIHPYSNFRFYWDCITLLLLITSMLVIPVAISFFNDEMTTDSGWIAFNLSLDVWFLFDIVANFHTGVIVDSGDGDVILDLKTIRLQYLRSWFIIDLVSTIPVDYLLQVTIGNSASVSASRALKFVRLAKIVSLLRLLRISRLIRYVHQWEQIVGMQYDLAVAVVRIFNLVCLMLLIGHWNGCLQFLVPMVNEFPNNSWVRLDDLVDKPWGEQYSWSLFKAMSHMLCIGYGREQPQNLMDLWMTMISMISGAVCFAMFIGHATALIQSMDSSKRQYKEKYMQVKEYMRYRRLPKSLRKRVFDYYDHRFQGKMFDEVGILGELSANLKEDVVNHNCRHLVHSVPFFKNTDPDFVTEVVQKLKFEVFQPDDVIVKEGSSGKKMYFIQHGVVEIRKSGTEKPIKTLSDGSFFGEICLLINDRRVASVVAVTYCATYSLHVDDFNTIQEEFPVMRKTLERVAAARLFSLGKLNTALEKKLNESKILFSETNELVDQIVRHDDDGRPRQRRSKLSMQKEKSAGINGVLKTSKSVGCDVAMSFVLTPTIHRKCSSSPSKGTTKRSSASETSVGSRPGTSYQSESSTQNDGHEASQVAVSRDESRYHLRRSQRKLGVTKQYFSAPKFFSSMSKRRSFGRKSNTSTHSSIKIKKILPSPHFKHSLSTSNVDPTNSNISDREKVLESNKSESSHPISQPTSVVEINTQETTFASHKSNILPSSKTKQTSKKGNNCAESSTNGLALAHNLEAKGFEKTKTCSANTDVKIDVTKT
ncbi:unnamed protein product [Clavelina lepadiformis]|uniref:Cyclic nucleotide-binding domain-containing protein n=1 Tax=Clavelina lepadiformis TaxID=159417 RepID=A0ABP0GRE8_CLALP